MDVCPYIAVHWRRGDFLITHPNVVPNATHIAHQINEVSLQYNIPIFFVATDDANQIEILEKELKAIRGNTFCKVFGYPHGEKYYDLEYAIIEQTILVPSSIFFGTEYSTFTMTVRDYRNVGFSSTLGQQTLYIKEDRKLCTPDEQGKYNCDKFNYVSM